MGKTYEGFRDPGEPTAQGECTVLVDGKPLPLKPSLKAWNHSPTGFSWGYAGSGPAQLALAILLDHLKNKQRALDLHQDFKFRVVAKWPQGENWTITGFQIDAIVREIEEARR